jgi:preprotein translocase subunit YajC
MFISPAFAQAAGGAAGGSSMLTQLMPLVLIFAVFYFLLIRPQQKKAKEHKAMISAVRRGDKVVTAGGIMGKITKVYDDDRAMVEIAEGVRIEVVQSTLTAVMSKSEPADGGSGKKGDDSKGDDSKGDDKEERAGAVKKPGGLLGGLLGGKK